MATNNSTNNKALDWALSPAVGDVSINENGLLYTGYINFFTNSPTALNLICNTAGPAPTSLSVSDGSSYGVLYDTYFNPVPQTTPSFIPYSTGSVAAISFGKSYLALDPDDQGTTQFTMPTSGFSPGDVLNITGGNTPWSLSIGAGQAIFMGDVYVADSGALSATTNRCSVTLVCMFATPGNQLFTVFSSFGELSLA